MIRFVYLSILFLILPLSCREITQQPGGAEEPNPVEPVEVAGENLLVPNKTAREAAVKRLDDYFKRRAKYNGFNGTVLYAVDGVIEYSEAFGYSNLRKKDSLKLESSFQLASVSKPITALATLVLIDQEKISLKDSIQSFFPEFPYKGITVQMLLNHRSGLPNYMYFADSLWTNTEVPITNWDVLDLMIEHHPMRYYPPDVRYNYCNTNYALLALIIEDVSEMAFELFVKTRIFLPLEMHNSQIYNKSITPDNFHSVIGYSSGRRVAENTYLNGVVGDKGVYASVLDLFKLDNALRSGSLITHELLDKAFEPQHKDLYQWDNYGLGWRIDATDPNNKVVYHTGWWKGFRSYFIRELGSKKTLIVLSNTARTSSLGTRELRKLI